MDRVQTISRRRAHRPSHTGTYPPGLHPESLRAEAIAQNQHGRVSIGTVHGVRIAVRTEIVPGHVAQYLSGRFEGGGEDEEGIADAY